MAEASRDARVVPSGAACRINALSTDVLLRAISFLEARQLVQTCVLSRRWRNLWRSFDGKAGTEIAYDVLFKNFINRFLMLRNPVALHEFRLQYKDANLWIRHALQSNVRLIEVFGGSIDLHLDPAVFASKFCFVTSMLLTLVFLEPPFFKNLQTGCTVLERLVLRSCIIYDPEISSHTLKVLTIDARIPLLKNMESLVTASFAFGTNDDLVDDMCQFLWSLHGITDLEFNYRGPKLEIKQDLQLYPKFNNLTTLTLGNWCVYEYFYALTIFLQNSPNLEQLTLKLRNGFNKSYPNLEDNLEDRSFTCEHLEDRSFTCEHLVIYVARIRGYGYRYTIRRYVDTPISQKHGYGIRRYI
ncbi:hypothetical protein HU200_042081 [Digitaria exilis]|uniref:F-box domain-containing protein n=1 Tax=Digitaria exilis TaxID=1010633 RepID=A0A835BED6_9POAL|nr:hypothetical protein HU200_042081 [Digitaria exilis]